MATVRRPSDRERDFTVLYYLDGAFAEERTVRGVGIDRIAIETANSEPHRMVRSFQRGVGIETDLRMVVGETEDGTPVTALIFGDDDPAGEHGTYRELALSFGIGGGAFGPAERRRALDGAR